MPAYIVVITWSFMLQKDNGAVNALLGDLHITNLPFWLVGTNAFWSMVMTAIWCSWPLAFLFLLAGLQTIPSDMYFDSLPKGLEEAAGIDGASPLFRSGSGRKPHDHRYESIYYADS